MVRGQRAPLPMPLPPLSKQRLCPSNTTGVGSVNFCTIDFGGAFFNSFYCVPRVLPITLVLRCTLFIFCAKAALLAKRAAACDRVEISDNFDKWMSQQCCEWIGDKVDERKLSDKSPIPCPDHQEFANIVAAVYAHISSQN